MVSAMHCNHEHKGRHINLRSPQLPDPPPGLANAPHILADTESITSVVFLAQPVAAVYRGLTAKL